MYALNAPTMRAASALGAAYGVGSCWLDIHEPVHHRVVDRRCADRYRVDAYCMLTDICSALHRTHIAGRICFVMSVQIAR